MDQRTRHWLGAELERWVVEELITAEQRDQIALRYPPLRGTSPLVMAFAVIGALLMGAGIILVFATNWWSLPIGVRLVLAFLPLLLGQGLCLYTWKRKYHSAPFREGSALFLSLSFFAALALVGQIFHTPSDMGSYVLICSLVTLPGVYLFRGRAAAVVYVAGTLFVAWQWPTWVFFVMAAALLPFFWLALRGTAQRRGMNVLLLLLSLLTVQGLMLGTVPEVSGMEVVLLCALALLVMDALFCRVGKVYFFTVCKLLAVVGITAGLLFSLQDFLSATAPSPLAVGLGVALTVGYLLLRRGSFPAPTGGDLIFGAGMVLLLTGALGWLVSTLLVMGLGAAFLVRGSRTLTLSHINYGMALVIGTIVLRFFDSGLGLLGRGVVFILLGVVFLGINLYISRKKGRVNG